MTRKEFLALTSMGITGTYLTLHSDAFAAMMGGGMGGGGMGGGMGGGTSVIDPPPGLAFKDPIEAVKNSNGV